MARRRRRQRDDEFDDTLERSHMIPNNNRSTGGSHKRIKVNDDNENDDVGVVSTSREFSTTAESSAITVVDTTGVPGNVKEENEQQQQQIERLRLKKRLRKERKKAKGLERLQVVGTAKKNQQMQQQQTAAGSSSSSNNTEKHAMVHCRKGVQYQDIVVGKGPMVQDRKKVYVKYTLRKLNETGKIIDSSEQFGFRIGKGEVIEGWDIGLEGMKQGGIRHLIIPPEAGYGKKDIGAGKGGMLFFKVILLGC